MTYEEALAFIHGTYKFGSKLGLDNIKNLLERLDSPQLKLKFIHVAGTNGKGSTSSFIHSVLVKSGYKTGLYTSPFIETFNERIRVNHTLITADELAKFTLEVKVQIDNMVAEGFNHPTEFEVVTAIAMLYYVYHQCDVVVLEVGLGGRLDATNVIETPLVSVITPLAIDHTEYLGDTIEAIALEKAGIIKKGGITVSYPQTQTALEVIKSKCAEMNNQLLTVDFSSLSVIDAALGNLEFEFEDKKFSLSLFAPYQAENASVAIKTIEVLVERFGFEINGEALKEGLKMTKWIGRMEILSDDPFVIIDGAHNLHGIRGLVNSLEIIKKDYKVVGLVGILKDKDIDGMISEIAPFLDAVITTRPDNPRALSSDALKVAFENQGVNVIFNSESIQEAIKKLYEVHHNSDEKVLYLGFGSLYMIGEVRTAVLKAL